MTNPKKFVEFLENLSVERLGDIQALYAEELDFKDPINEALTREHFVRIQEDLFKQLKNIKITVTSMKGGDRESFVSWVMTYDFRWWGREIEGVSHVKWDTEGQIVYQHDYWDASLPVYGEFPPMGLLMKGIKNLLEVKSGS